MRIELMEYLDSSLDARSHLSQKGRESLVTRFNELVEVYETEKIPQALDRIVFLSKSAYARFWHIRRLPNSLLFGADTLGPDLSREFALLIDNQESAEAYHKEAQDRMRFQANGRSINYFPDGETAIRLGIPTDEIMYAVHPRGLDVIFASSFPIGTCISFFEPKNITKPSGFGHDAYLAPSPLATKRILVSWNMPLNLKG